MKIPKEQREIPVNDAVTLNLQEFPFFTLTSFPAGFLVHVGGVVSARSVKLLDRIHNPGEFCARTRARTHAASKLQLVPCPVERCEGGHEYRATVQSRRTCY